MTKQYISDSGKTYEREADARRDDALWKEAHRLAAWIDQYTDIVIPYTALQLSLYELFRTQRILPTKQLE